MGRWLGRAAGAVLGVAVLGYAGICGWFYSRQDTLVYPGGTVAVERPPAVDTVGLADFQSITLKTPDGETLVAWWHPPVPGRGVVLYLHGNLHSLGLPTRVARFRDIADLGLGVLAIEYRGFGGSSGHPGEAGLITDAETAYDYIQAQVPGARVALFGESLGTGVAVALATRRPVAGVALDSPYDSILRLARLGHPWLPNGLLLRSPWDSEARIGAIKAPLFIAHCDADRVIPLAEGLRLFDAASEPKRKSVLSGCGHIQIWQGDTRTALLDSFQTWTAP